MDPKAGSLRLAHDEVPAGKPFILSQGDWQLIIFSSIPCPEEKECHIKTLKMQVTFTCVGTSE